jgi:hypothetical protein
MHIYNRSSHIVKIYYEGLGVLIDVHIGRRRDFYRLKICNFLIKNRNLYTSEGISFSIKWKFLVQKK